MTLPPHPELVRRIERRLARPLPGFAAQARMAPLGRRDERALRAAEGKDARQAAVLVLLYPLEEGSETAFVLTERQPSLRDHSGQIALPGGSRDGAESAEETALREGFEEVGVDPAVPRVLGRLTPLYIPPSRFSVVPVVAAMDARPPFVAQEAEVAALLEIPLAHLLDPALLQSSERPVFGGSFEVPHFALAGREAWGATAMMLAEFAAVAAEAVG